MDGKGLKNVYSCMMIEASFRTWPMQNQSIINRKTVKISFPRQKNPASERFPRIDDQAVPTTLVSNAGKNHPFPPVQCWGKNSCPLIAFVSPTLNGGAGEISCKTKLPRL